MSVEDHVGRVNAVYVEAPAAKKFESKLGFTSEYAQ